MHLLILAVPEEERCETGDVRLVNGSRLAGRLEVCFNGVWGTVCRLDTWDRGEASVVCRQLGFTNSSASEWMHPFLFGYLSFHTHTVPIGVTTDIYGAGPSTQPILIRDVECSGNERNISECMHSEVNNLEGCLHGNDAGVICEGSYIYIKTREPLTKYF